MSTTPSLNARKSESPGGTPNMTQAHSISKSAQTEAMQVSWFAPFRSPAITVVNLSLFFLLWELIARLELVNPLFFPRASAVFKAMWVGFTEGTLLQALGHSLTNLLIGLLISVAIGVPIGLLMGASKVADLVLTPYVWAMNSLPRVALIPLLILILGFGNTMQLTIIVLSAVFPIMVNCMAGVKTVDPSLLRAAKVFGTNRFQVYRKVVLPFTLPFVISGINQGIARGLVGMLIGELLGGAGAGLGFLLNRAGDNFDSPNMYAVLIVLAVMSVALVQSMNVLERRAAPWRAIPKV